LWPTVPKWLTDLQAAVDAGVANPPASPLWPGLHAAAIPLLQGAPIPIAQEALSTLSHESGVPKDMMSLYSILFRLNLQRSFRPEFTEGRATLIQLIKRSRSFFTG
jgi:hypothetical protein